MLHLKKTLLKKGKFSQSAFENFKEHIIAARAEFKKGKSDSHKIDRARKDASILINDLIEYLTKM